MASLGGIFDAKAVMADANFELVTRLCDAGLLIHPCNPAPKYNPDGTKNPDSKKPLGISSWKAPLTRARIEQLWRRFPNAMPGINMDASGFLVIDCDEDESGTAHKSIAAWEKICADNGGVSAPYVDTPSGGRHYYFRQPPEDKLGNSPGKLRDLTDARIDVRGSGGYIIGPGSERMDGTYIPSDEDPLCIMDAPVVPEWLIKILKPEKPEPAQPTAASPVSVNVNAEHPLIREYVQTAFNEEIRALALCGAGGRNNQLNASGFALYQLAAAKWSGLSVSEVDAALERAAEDCGLVADDGAASVRKTIRSAKRGGMSNPRPVPEELAHHIEMEAAISNLGAMSAVALAHNEETGEIINEETGEVYEAPQIESAQELPDEFTRVPGLVGDIADWIEGTARRPSRALALSAALTVAGTIIGRRLATPTRSGTHLYVLGLAKSGAGKDHALVQSERLLAACGMASAIGPDEFMSQTALINRLGRSPLMHCAMDEFGAFMAYINNPRSGPHVAGISKILRSAWGRSFAPLKTPEWAGKSSETIQAPALSLLGASTPEEFYAALNGRDVVNGFLNRFLVFPSLQRPDDRDPPINPKDVPEHIIKRIESLFGGGSSLAGITGQLYSDPNAEVEPIIVPWADDAARDVFLAFQKRIQNIQDKDAKSEAFYARTAEMAVRMATIRAAGINVLKPSVSVEDMQWGRDLAMWSFDRLAADAGMYMAETEQQKNANNVLRLLVDAGGKMSRKDLVLALKHNMKARDLDDVLKLMKEAEQITEDLVKTATRPVRFYFLKS